MSAVLDDREDDQIRAQLARFGLPLTIARLDFGDLAIRAETRDIAGMLIGFERKKLTDLIACMQDRRLSGFQLQGMRALYDRVELVVEGMWRPGESGEIQVPRAGSWQPLYDARSRGAISYRQVDAYLYSQTELGGVRVWRTASVWETACLYTSRYYWWAKDYSAHKSHDPLYSNDPSAQRRGAVTVFNGEPNSVVLVAAQIPGIDAKAWDIGKQFDSVAGMCAASERDWQKISWTDRAGNVKHFGKESACAIVAWLNQK